MRSTIVLISGADGPSADKVFPGGDYQVCVTAGSWNAGTVSLQVKCPDDVYRDLAVGASFTANGTAVVRVPSMAIRAQVAGPTNVTMWLGRIF